MRKEVFLKATKEFRRKPANFHIADKYLFEKEFIRSYKDIDSIKFEKAYYYKGNFYNYRFNNLSLIFQNHYLKYINTYLKQIKDKRKELNFLDYFKVFIKNALRIQLQFLKYILKNLYRSVIKFLRIYQIKSLSSIKVEKGALLTANWSWTNYFHWNHDFLPLILFYYESNKKDNNIVIPITFLKKAPFVEETLRTLGIEYTILDNKSKYFFSNLEIIDASLNPGNQRAHLIRNLRKRFYQSYNLKVKNKKEIIYISRRDNSKTENTNIRNISNEEECIKLFNKFKIRVISTLGLSVIEQLNIFSNCKTLIAVHGAGLTNMIFMKSKSNILEIRQKDDQGNNCYFSMASALKHNYYYLNGINLKSSDIMNASLYVDLNDLENKLIEIID